VALSVELNALLNLLSASVALLVSFYAFKTNRLVGSSLLRYICVGFMLLGVGLLTEGIAQLVTGTIPVDAARLAGFNVLDFLFSISVQLIAYLIFAWGYAKSAFGEQQEIATAAPILAAATGGRLLRLLVFSLAVFLVAQLGIIVLMLFVVVQGVFVYSRTSSKFALTVLVAWVLIFGAHILLFSSVVYLSANLYLVGNLVQFVGFLSLLYFLYRSDRVGSS
jgi:hypothetical protein